MEKTDDKGFTIIEVDLNKEKSRKEKRTLRKAKEKIKKMY